MSINIEHAYPKSAYLITERVEGVLIRFIILDSEEMKQLSERLKEKGF